MRLDHEELRALLPHRHPMLLLDRVTAVEPGTRLAAEKAISGCEPCYRLPDDQGPAGRYAYPTTLLLESFGQAAAVLWLVSAERDGRRPAGLPMFVAARDCRFDHPVFPGDVIRHEVRLDQSVDGAAFASGETWVGTRQVASFGSMMAVVRPSETVSTRATP